MIYTHKSKWKSATKFTMFKFVSLKYNHWSCFNKIFHWGVCNPGVFTYADRNSNGVRGKIQYCNVHATSYKFERNTKRVETVLVQMIKIL